MLILSQLAEALVHVGRWDEAEARCVEATREQELADFPLVLILPPRVRMLLARGELGKAREALERVNARSSDRQSQASYRLTEASVLNAEGRSREALEGAVESLERWRALIQFHYLTEALVEAATAAFALDDLERVEALLATADDLPLIQQRPSLDAQTARIAAVLAARQGRPADEGFELAATRFRELQMPFWVAVTELEHAEFLVRTGRAEEAEPLLAEAAGTFERLRAEPWLERTRVAGALEARVH